jgi:hypothetical protein
VVQQGQVFKLKARSAEGEPLWAYRYRVAGRGWARLQVGGFGSRAEAQRALQNKLAWLVPGGRSATLTLGECVAEYLEAHQGERATVAKLRWLLGIPIFVHWWTGSSTGGSVFSSGATLVKAWGGGRPRPA